MSPSASWKTNRILIGLPGNDPDMRTTTIVAFAALLVTQQASIFTGYALRTGAWIRDTQVADLWVMDEQAEFTEANKPMLDTALGRVRGIDGVQWAVPMIKAYLKARLPDGTRLTVRVIGLDDATLTGGPPEVVDGTLADLRRDRAVLINADHAATSLKLARGLPKKCIGEISIDPESWLIRKTSGE